MSNQELNEESTKQVEKPETTEKHAPDKFGTVGWALFFIWVGIAFLAGFHIGVGLLGIGVITLGVQIARKQANLQLEGFWVVIGLLFLLGGLWELFEPTLPLLPILLIVAGLLLLISLSRRRHPVR